MRRRVSLLALACMLALLGGGASGRAAADPIVGVWKYTGAVESDKGLQVTISATGSTTFVGTITTAPAYTQSCRKLGFQIWQITKAGDGYKGRMTAYTSYPECKENGYWENATWRIDESGSVYHLDFCFPGLGGGTYCWPFERPRPAPALKCTGPGTVIAGTSRRDVLRGTEGNDTICGFDGNDTIYGLGGNDRIYGGDGNDTILAGAGDDLVYGGDGADRIEGGDGYDALVGDEENYTRWGGNDVIVGGPGNDRLYGWLGSDTLDAWSPGDDWHDADLISGGPGRDVGKMTMQLDRADKVERLTLCGIRHFHPKEKADCQTSNLG